VLQFLKVEYQLLRRSRRIQNLPLSTFELPPPPRRRRIDIAGYFEPVGSTDFFGEVYLTENIAYAPITTRIEDLQVEGFVRPFNPPLARVNTLVLVQFPTQGSKQIPHIVSPKV